ncbi:MAG TPA: GNAT family N-acetyltransferase [Gemmatimonadaceae bacterium]|jgi:GNAT superfamily N-acetyltransferase
MTTARVATPEDAPALADLLGQLGYPTSAESLPTRVAALNAQGGVVFVAVAEEGRVVGLASGARHATIHADGEVAYITALVTDGNARRQGVGRALLAALEQWALTHGCTRLSVTSAEHRADAHAFYPRCGFPYTGRRFTKHLTP